MHFISCIIVGIEVFGLLVQFFKIIQGECLVVADIKPAKGVLVIGAFSELLLIVPLFFGLGVYELAINSCHLELAEVLLFWCLRGKKRPRWSLSTTVSRPSRSAFPLWRSTQFPCRLSLHCCLRCTFPTNLTVSYRFQGYRCTIYALINERFPNTYRKVRGYSQYQLLSLSFLLLILAPETLSLFYIIKTSIPFFKVKYRYFAYSLAGFTI